VGGATPRWHSLKSAWVIQWPCPGCLSRRHGPRSRGNGKARPLPDEALNNGNTVGEPRPPTKRATGHRLLERITSGHVTEGRLRMFDSLRADGYVDLTRLMEKVLADLPA
jgi:hypothetical protein